PARPHDRGVTGGGGGDVQERGRVGAWRGRAGEAVQRDGQLAAGRGRRRAVAAIATRGNQALGDRPPDLGGEGVPGRHVWRREGRAGGRRRAGQAEQEGGQRTPG